MDASIDLNGGQLAGAYLPEGDLSGADLSNADLSMSNLSSATLSNADLSNANLRIANLSSATLSNADLNNANLWGADLSNADLSNADLSNANLLDANLSNAYLRGANLSNAYLRGANLLDANLSNADLSGADLSYAYLRGANLLDANLSNANLNGTYCYLDTLEGANVHNVYLRAAAIHPRQRIDKLHRQLGWSYRCLMFIVFAVVAFLFGIFVNSVFAKNNSPWLPYALTFTSMAIYVLLLSSVSDRIIKFFVIVFIVIALVGVIDGRSSQATPTDYTPINSPSPDYGNDSPTTDPNTDTSNTGDSSKSPEENYQECVAIASAKDYSEIAANTGRSVEDLKDFFVNKVCSDLSEIP